eukprot:PhF_6_TR20530/c0_g1_i2/m.29631
MNVTLELLGTATNVSPIPYTPIMITTVPKADNTTCGPYQLLWADPTRTVVGVVIAGSIVAGGTEAIVEGIVRSCQDVYGVKRIVGFRYGFVGMCDCDVFPPADLTTCDPRSVGFLLGTSLKVEDRHNTNIEMMRRCVSSYKINCLFVVGDSYALYIASLLGSTNCAVIAVSSHVDSSQHQTQSLCSGYTLVARDACLCVKSLKRIKNRVSVLLLSGSYLTLQTSLNVSNEDNGHICLVPEFELSFDEIKARVETLLAKRKNCVILASESYPVDWNSFRNMLLKSFDVDINILKHSLTLGRYSDHANGFDFEFGRQVGLNCVHAAMAGFTNCSVLHMENTFRLVPLHNILYNCVGNNAVHLKSLWDEWYGKSLNINTQLQVEEDRSTIYPPNVHVCQMDPIAMTCVPLLVENLKKSAAENLQHHYILGNHINSRQEAWEFALNYPDCVVLYLNGLDTKGHKQLGINTAKAMIQQVVDVALKDAITRPFSVTITRQTEWMIPFPTYLNVATIDCDSLTHILEGIKSMDHVLCVLPGDSPRNREQDFLNEITEVFLTTFPSRVLYTQVIDVIAYAELFCQSENGDVVHKNDVECCKAYTARACAALRDGFTSSALTPLHGVVPIKCLLEPLASQASESGIIHGIRVQQLWEQSSRPYCEYQCSTLHQAQQVLKERGNTSGTSVIGICVPIDVFAVEPQLCIALLQDSAIRSNVQLVLSVCMSLSDSTQHPQNVLAILQDKPFTYLKLELSGIASHVSALHRAVEIATFAAECKVALCIGAPWMEDKSNLVTWWSTLIVTGCVICISINMEHEMTSVLQMTQLLAKGLEEVLGTSKVVGVVETPIPFAIRISLEKSDELGDEERQHMGNLGVVALQINLCPKEEGEEQGSRTSDSFWSPSKSLRDEESFCYQQIR